MRRDMIERRKTHQGISEAVSSLPPPKINSFI
jgi:hypothetical protein